MKYIRFIAFVIIFASLLTICCYADAHVYEVKDCDVVVACVEGHTGSMQSYTQDIYDYGNFKSNGIILAIDTLQREYYICTTGTCIDTFDDYAIYKIEEKIIPYLRAGDYQGAENVFVTQVKSQMYSGIKGLIYKILAALGIGSLVGGAPMLKQKKEMENVSKKASADDYIKPGSLSLIDHRDIFLHTAISKIPIPQNNPPSGPNSSHGGSTISVGSSGVEHGGHGGKF